VKFVVGDSGQVEDVKIVKGHPLFDEVVLAAVRGWTFEPATARGQARAHGAHGEDSVSSEAFLKREGARHVVQSNPHLGSMGLLSKIIASLLLVMATMSLAVGRRALVAIIRAKGETRKFLRLVVPILSALEYPKAAELADHHKASPFARLIAPILRKLSPPRRRTSRASSWARREAERQKEAGRRGAPARHGRARLGRLGRAVRRPAGNGRGINQRLPGHREHRLRRPRAVSAGISEALVETALVSWSRSRPSSSSIS